MKRLAIVLYFCAILVLPWACQSGGSAPALVVAPSTTIAAHDLATLRAALLKAETTPNTTVSMDPTNPYVLLDQAPLRIRGVGTKLLGNNALVIGVFWYSGQPDPITGEPMPGTPILMTPRLGPIEPFAAQDNAIWLNDAGGAAAFDPSAGAYGVFHEEAPVQYPSPLYAAYTKAYPIIVPCDGCSITNLRVQGSGIAPVFIGFRSRRCTVDNLQTANITTMKNVCLEGSEDCVIQNCRLTVSGIQLNSSTRCTVRNCNVDGIALEEVARWNTLDSNTVNHIDVNDPTCSNNTFTGNTVTGILANNGSGLVMAIRNKCGGSLRMNQFVTGGIVSNNTATEGAGIDARIVQTGNSWQPK